MVARAIHHPGPGSDGPLVAVNKLREETGQRRFQRSAVEPEAVRNVLEATGWNIAMAARRLRISRTTLYKRIGQLGIQRPAD